MLLLYCGDDRTEIARTDFTIMFSEYEYNTGSFCKSCYHSKAKIVKDFNADWSITLDLAKSTITKFGSCSGLNNSKKLSVKLKIHSKNLSGNIKLKNI